MKVCAALATARPAKGAKIGCEKHVGVLVLGVVKSELAMLDEHV